MTILSLIWKPVLALLALVGSVFFIRHGARKQAKADAMEADYEHAQDIRRRVADDRADRVRKLDDAGFRD
jgi:hypothetical protein